jgi:AcrR family transcriptional regulator
MCQNGGMAPRKYEQVQRAETAEETRRRILVAVGQCLREKPTEQPSLGRVAELAGVSRSTIYADFGSRSGLFDAFVVDLWERTGLGELGEAVASADARDHLRASIEAASRMKAQELTVYRVLHAMDRLDPASAGGAVRHMEQDRRGGVQSLAEHLDREGVLRAGLSVEAAVDVLWVLTSFESLDLLVSGRGRSVEEAVETLVDAAERVVCRTPGAPAARGRGA